MGIGMSSTCTSSSSIMEYDPKLSRNYKDDKGCIQLEGGEIYRELTHSKRVRCAAKGRCDRDVLNANAIAAICSDALGFSLEFEIIGNVELTSWFFFDSRLIKVTQTFAGSNPAPARITTVRGFYLLFVTLQDLLELVIQHQQILLKQATNCIDTREVQFEECPICMDHGVEVVPPCGHGTCKNCFESWHILNEHCPCCRAPLEEVENWVLSEDMFPYDLNAHRDELVTSVHRYVHSLPHFTSIHASPHSSKTAKASTLSQSVSGGELIGEVEEERLWLTHDQIEAFANEPGGSSSRMLRLRSQSLPNVAVVE